MTAFLTFLAVVAVLLFWGSQDAAGDAALERGALWALTLLAFPFVYIWQFLRAPAELDDLSQRQGGALVDQLNKVQGELEAKRDRRTSALLLSLLLERGNEYLAQRITEDQYDAWQKNVRMWEIRTVRVLAHFFSHQDATVFKHAVYMATNNFIFSINEQHNDKLRQIVVRLEVLRGILSQHRENWATITKEERKLALRLLESIEVQSVASDG
ncbi:hypothetical protein [Pelagibius sp. 7325]|uniref:hypothetical protein n=1 Tax=Pelagibius sp. 7325 TaxID=3131994 RepID=UPI0030EF4064